MEEEEEEAPPVRRVLGATEVRKEDEVGGLMDEMDEMDVRDLRGLRERCPSKTW